VLNQHFTVNSTTNHQQQQQCNRTCLSTTTTSSISATSRGPMALTPYTTSFNGDLQNSAQNFGSVISTKAMLLPMTVIPLVVKLGQVHHSNKLWSAASDPYMWTAKTAAA
jgi:hypothetical protein